MRSADVRTLRRLAALVERELGVRMPEAKLTMLRSRIDRRLRDLDTSVAAYCELLHDPAHAAEERTRLFDLVTTNKTDFLREPAHFAYLDQRALPALAAGQGTPWTCRVWCAGCATGEEVYTLAMVLDDHARRNPGFDYEIHGTDISTRALRAAIGATYKEELIAPVPTEWRRRYLLRSTDRSAARVRIVRALRERCTFSRLNFMDAEYPLGEFDIVFFRNVMIYFDRPTRQRVVERQCAHLRPGGFLFIGHTESISDLALPLAAESASVWRRTA